MTFGLSAEIPTPLIKQQTMTARQQNFNMNAPLCEFKIPSVQRRLVYGE